MIHCDNEAVVNIVNKGRSKMADIMKLMRTLTWTSVRNNFTIHCKHIPGAKNVIADSLSRFNFQTFRATFNAMSSILQNNLELNNSSKNHG
jgi:hypothetical protein